MFNIFGSFTVFFFFLVRLRIFWRNFVEGSLFQRKFFIGGIILGEEIVSEAQFSIRLDF